MKEKSEIVTTSIRMSEELSNEIQALCNAGGGSRNTMMIVLMQLGLQIFKGNFSVNLDKK